MCFSASGEHHFLKSKQRWAPFLPGFSGILLRFSRILPRFLANQDFWVRLHHRILHHCVVVLFVCSWSSIAELRAINLKNICFFSVELLHNGTRKRRPVKSNEAIASATSHRISNYLCSFKWCDSISSLLHGTFIFDITSCGNQLCYATAQ